MVEKLSRILCNLGCKNFYGTHYVAVKKTIQVYLQFHMTFLMIYVTYLNKDKFVVTHQQQECGSKYCLRITVLCLQVIYFVFVFCIDIVIITLCNIPNNKCSHITYCNFTYSFRLKTIYNRDKVQLQNCLQFKVITLLKYLFIAGDFDKSIIKLHLLLMSSMLAKFLEN